MSRRPVPLAVRGHAVAALLVVLLTSCTTDPPAQDPPVVKSPAASETGPHPEHAQDPPGPLRDPLLPADLLVWSQEPLPASTVRQIRRLSGVDEVEQLSLGQVGVQDRVVTVAAVDPATYRRFTPVGTARSGRVWERVAGGELAVVPRLERRARDEEGRVRLGNDEDAARVHVGAVAPQVPRVDAVLNASWGRELGLPEGNALLVSTGFAAPQRVRPAVERLLEEGDSVQVLGPDLDLDAVQTAVLTGGSVAEAVGTFSYRVLGGGRIAPEQEWVEAHIRTERVPLLGEVTCHRVVLPQLRAALREVVAAGLADEIHPDEYAGCYHPRFIAGTQQLSLHSFGIALDLNVPGNQRGTVGEMHRGVVATMERWGFAWGGRWAWTDPMHFEMDRLVSPGGGPARRPASAPRAGRPPRAPQG